MNLSATFSKSRERSTICFSNLLESLVFTAPHSDSAPSTGVKIRHKVDRPSDEVESLERVKYFVLFVTDFYFVVSAVFQCILVNEVQMGHHYNRFITCTAGTKTLHLHTKEVAKDIII